MENFYSLQTEERRLVVKEGDTLKLGKHTLKFIAAPMVHWPEVLMTYDVTDKILFSADTFVNSISVLVLFITSCQIL